MSLEKKIEDYLAQLRGSGPLSDEKNEVDIAKNVDSDVDSSSSTAKNYDRGGAVNWDEGNKTDTVMKMLGMSQPPAPANDSFSVGAGDTTAVTPSLPASAVPAPAPQPQPVAQAAPAPKPKAAPSARPPAQDLLAKLTDNDSTKMQALLDQLQDSDKRGAFAQALGVIGDTFGNIGNAKAGMAPQGFTSTELVTKQNEAARGKLQDNAKMQLMVNPNSQTSRMAQMSLLQAMNIPQNDPRAASILKMPAQSIISTMPQLTDSIKLQLERESNSLQSKQLESNIKDRDLQLKIAGDTQKAVEEKNRGDLANNMAEHTSIFNPVHYQAQHAAAQMAGLGQPSAPAQGGALTATNAMGHKIRSVDGGKTWAPVQ